MSSDALAVRAFDEGAVAQSAIDVAGLGKRYEIYDRPHQRLFQTILRGRRTFYREFWALSDVTLSVQRGETVGLVGRNGSGKSTLLQLVAGTLTPTTGIVRTHGRIAALLELGSGFNPEFTGRENVYLNGAILGISRREMNEAIAGDRGVRRHRRLHRPTGEDLFERDARAPCVRGRRACHAGHSDHRRGTRRRRHGIPEQVPGAHPATCSRAGVAILLVSHAPNTIIEFCDRAAYLDRGRLVAVGDCRDIVERYTNDLVSSFGGTTLPSAPDTGPGAFQRSTKPRQRATAPRAMGPKPPTEIISVAITDEAGVPKHAFSCGGIVCIRIEVEFHRDNPAPCYGHPDQESRRHRAVDVHHPIDGSHAAAEAGGRTRDA